MIDVKFKTVDHERFKEMDAWCREHFGPPAWWKAQLKNANSPVKWIAASEMSVPGTQEESGQAVFCFRDDKDSTLFSLRWAEENESKPEV